MEEIKPENGSRCILVRDRENGEKRDEARQRVRSRVALTPKDFAMLCSFSCQTDVRTRAT